MTIGIDESEKCRSLPFGMKLYDHPLSKVEPTAQPEQPDTDKLLQIIAAMYQIAGVYDAPVHVLDLLANPQMAEQEQIDALLPFNIAQPEQRPVQPTAQPERNFCGRCGQRLGDADHIHTCTPPESKS